MLLVFFSHYEWSLFNHISCVLKDFSDGWNAWGKGRRSFNGPPPVCIFMPKIGESSCQNRGVFIALEMCKSSLCPSSHDHAKFSHDCAKLIRVVQIYIYIFLALWTISHNYANISHDYAKSSLSTEVKWTLWTTSHTYAKISHGCAKIFFKRKKTKLPPI